MTEQAESALHKDGPVERLENALVRMAFILEQRESHIAQQKKQKEAEIAKVIAHINALQDKVAVILQETDMVEEKKG